MKLSLSRPFFFLICCLSLLSLNSSETFARETLTMGKQNAVINPNAASLARNKLIFDAAKMLEIEIVFKDIPARRSLQLVSEGKLQAEISRHAVIETVFPNLIRVDEATGYLDYWVWVADKADCPSTVGALEKLKPIGLRGLIFYEKYIFPKSKVGYEVVNAPKQLVAMLNKQRADYTVQSKQMMSLPEFNNIGTIKPCFDAPLFTLNFYFYLHPSKKHLKHPFEIALRKIKYGY